MKRWAAAFVYAMTLLTRIPVPFYCKDIEQQAKNSVLFFPVCGLLVGAAGALVYYAASYVASAMVCAILCIGAQVLITGALHVDGLADCADAFGLKRDRQDTLRIMRDSRLGTYGVVAIVLSVLLKIILLTQCGARDPMQAVWIAMAVPVAGKCGSVALILLGGNAHNDGIGAPFLIKPKRVVCTAALVLGIALVFVLTHYMGVIFCVAGALCALWFGHRVTKRLGGLTGDILGAGNEITEMVFLLGGTVLLGG